VPRPRLAMRNVRDILRLALGQGLSHRQVGAALGIPFTTVSDHLRRAKSAGVSWPLPDEMDDAALEAALFRKDPTPPTEMRPVPDWHEVNSELRRPGVTLMLLWVEYRERHPDGYSYSQYCYHYRAFQKSLDRVMRQEHKAGKKLFVDFAGRRRRDATSGVGESPCCRGRVVGPVQHILVGRCCDRTRGDGSCGLWWTCQRSKSCDGKG
jgi:hypothetical protein